jgi:3-dehydroquinate synthase
MMPIVYSILGAKTHIHFNQRVSALRSLCSRSTTIFITDENVAATHPTIFKGWRTIVLKPGEAFKQQAAVDECIRQLTLAEADRSTTVVGIGGGVVTDVAGFVASVYMRGVKVGFVPTTLLGMVDAALGGKNGVDAGPLKNLVGTIRQPSFLLYDPSLLKTLSDSEWSNGFAEIIKHAAIKDAAMFGQLEKKDLKHYQKNLAELQELIVRNVKLKMAMVQKDPLENGIRRLLNFGHTLGHAIETHLEIPHGQAVSVGMVYESQMSSRLLPFADTLRMVETCERYGLPTHAAFDWKKALANMKHDKKRDGNTIRFVLLQKMGKAVVSEISLNRLQNLLKEISG